METGGYPDHELEDARTCGVPFCRSIHRERIPGEREYQLPKITGKGLRHLFDLIDGFRCVRSRKIIHHPDL